VDLISGNKKFETKLSEEREMQNEYKASNLRKSGRARTFSAVQIAFLNSITMAPLLMTPVITAAMSKLIKVVGSLSHFHVEAHVAQRCFPVVIVAELPFG